MKKIIYFCIDWTSPQYLAHASSYHKRLSSVLQAHCIKKDLLLLQPFSFSENEGKVKICRVNFEDNLKTSENCQHCHSNAQK